MREKILNAINDPNVTFFICPTPKLKELIVADQHPHIQKLSPWVKAALLEDKVLPVSKEDVLNFIDGKLSPQQQFLMSTAEVRLAGAAQILANKAVTQNEQGTR
jgi:hypothetical protein